MAQKNYKKPVIWLFWLGITLAQLTACASNATDPTQANRTTVTNGDSLSSAPATSQHLLPNVAPNSDGYVDLTVDQLAGLLPQKNFTLVNVHIPYEGELPQTDQFIPFDQIAANLDKLLVKDAPIVLYCRSGGMSTQAAAELAALGYTNLYELDGGFDGWAAAGHELVQK